MSTYVDYIDRVVDVLAFDGGTAGAATLEMTLAQPGQGGKICTGIQKLAQQFLIRLLTVKGSLKYLPLEGTDFLRLLQNGQLRSVTDLFSAFSAAELDIRERFYGDELQTDPEDERYESATLVSANISNSAADLVIRLTSRAGTNITFIAPLNLTV